MVPKLSKSIAVRSILAPKESITRPEVIVTCPGPSSLPHLSYGKVRLQPRRTAPPTRLVVVGSTAVALSVRWAKGAMAVRLVLSMIPPLAWIPKGPAYVEPPLPTSIDMVEEARIWTPDSICRGLDEAFTVDPLPPPMLIRP